MECAFMTLKEFCQCMGMSERKARDVMASANHPPYYRNGQKIMIYKGERFHTWLQDFLSRRDPRL